MDITESILTGVALAMDAFAVSVCFAAAAGGALPVKNSLLIALFFGGFQFLMPVLGYAASEVAYKFIEEYSHWIAFGILLFVGLKMIKEALSKDENKPVSKYADPSDLKLLFMLAVATSIDAFAIGVSIACRNIPIWSPSIIIGITTFLIALFGGFLGTKLEKILKGKAEIFGGVVLLLIAFKVLIEG